MHCLILAGGLGTRMRSITGDKTPKALLTIGEKPFIEWQVRWLKKLGMTKLILSIGHGGELIENFLNTLSDLNLEIKIVYDGPTLLGTGGAVKKSLGLLEENFFVTYGDSFLFFDGIKMMNAHLDSQKPITMMVYKNKNQGDKSNVSILNSEMIYDKKNIKPDMDYIDYGVSAFQRKYFLQNSNQDIFDLADLVSKASYKNEVFPYFAKHMFFEVGSPQGLENLSQFLRKHHYDLDEIYDQFIN